MAISTGRSSAEEISGGGCVFKVDPTFSGLTTLHQFNGTDGNDPVAPPVEGSDGNYYGTTSGTFVNNGGTIYKITSSGTFTLLHTFGAFGTKGGFGLYGPLVQGVDGNFYGTTQAGSQNDGTVFRITRQGTVTILHSFTGLDGDSPTGQLVLASDGNFYGTTIGGGSSGGGAAFRISSQGSFTLLQSFNTNVGVGSPVSSLMQASDGNLYGTAQFGIYQSTTSGVVTSVGVFDIANGQNPYVTPMQHTSGLIYGDTESGGEFENQGVIYTLNLSLPPFAALVPRTSKTVNSIGILGQGFTGATRVSFNGVAAKTFQVTSDTFMTATVPGAATTGLVTVTIPSGKLVSNQSFLVIPTITSFTPPSGAVGTAVTIKGASLAQTSKVTFGGITATFTVNSNSQVTATVPAGAVTGKIVVTTAGGVVTSSTAFTVTP